ncbi:hypothetical protein PhCBS80983_g06067, partial [Powellomyces hirtus]
MSRSEPNSPEHRTVPSPLGTRRGTVNKSSTSDNKRHESLSRLAAVNTDLGSPSATRRSTINTSSVHPPLSNVAAVDTYIHSDPHNLVQLVPALAHLLSTFCLHHPDACLSTWDAHVKPLLESLHTASTQRQQQHADQEQHRPPSPVCDRKPNKSVNVHGETWEDDYAWLTDRDNPDVLKYIQEENDYALTMLEHTKPLQKLLYREFVSRIDEGEHSARVVGQEYRLHCRMRDNQEDIYLDENELSNSPEFEDASYFRLGFLKHSPDGKLIAYGIDSSGNERYTTYFMTMDSDSSTHNVLADRIEGVYEDLEFATDNSVFYTVLDDCERAYKFKRHRLGSDVGSDDLLYHEEDEMFFLSLTKTCDGQYIVLNSSAQITSETRCISTEHPDDPPLLLFPRRENIQYSVESHGKYYYILTNEDSKNNWLFRIPIPSLCKSATGVDLLENRETVIEHRDFVLIEGFELRRNHLIVFERSNCLQNVRIVDLSYDGFNAYHYMSFPETVYSMWPGTVREEERSLAKASQFDTNVFRFTYTSFVQPKQVVDYNMDERVMTVVYEEHIGGYDSDLYTSKRLFATGVDGTTVPVSIVYRRDLLGQVGAGSADHVITDEDEININNATHSNTNLLDICGGIGDGSVLNVADHSNPCLLHAYGAYGAFVNPIFSSARLSLLDRGFIYAAAHVRGGADMGNGWYEEGKLAKKPNTFLDFCSVAEHLCKEGYTTPQKLAIYGRSAGGLLIGAAINMRPDLFAAALTEVPFVDVVNTMFDPSIPWTAFEYEEWGNPADKDIYDVMKTYCPYSNIRGEALARNAYPHLLVVGGMNDPRVAFFEPLKFVAKMRGEKRRARERNSANTTTPTTTTTTDRPHSPTATTTTTTTTTSHYSLANMAGGTCIDTDLPTHSTPRHLLLRIEDAGHGGSSGQYSFLENLAFEYAFIISALGVPGTEPHHLPTAAFPPSSPSSTRRRRNTATATPKTQQQQQPQPLRPHAGDATDSTESLDSTSGWVQHQQQQQPQQHGDAGTAAAAAATHRRKKRGQPPDLLSDVDEKEYRRKAKGDRGPSTLFQ